MTKNLKAYENELIKLLKKHADDGHFTHYYVECGQIESGPKFSAELSPDGLTAFDLSSLTKALVTTVLVLKDLKDRNLTTENALKDWASKDFMAGIDPWFHKIPIRKFLRHESGLPAWRNCWLKESSDHSWSYSENDAIDFKSRRVRILNKLNWVAKEKTLSESFAYSDLGFLLLGSVLETNLKDSLDNIFEKFIEPLNMQASGFIGFSNKAGIGAHAVSCGFCKLRNKKIQGIVHDENCASLGGVTGHSGLFARGQVVSEYLRKLSLSDFGKDVFNQQQEQLKSPPNDPLMGWRQGDSASSASFGGGYAMGHLGFTGTSFFMTASENKEPEDYMIFLTNRIISGRMPKKMPELRQKVGELLQKLVK